MYDGAVQDLIDELGRLPGIGPKSAQRIAFYLLSSDASDVARLAETITTVKEKVRFCTVCGNVAEAELCRVCADPRRGDDAICRANSRDRHFSRPTGESSSSMKVVTL